MAKLINIGFGNVVNSRKIVAVVSPDAAPVKRMIQSIKGTRSLIDATQGRKTKAVIVTSDDYLVLSALQPETIARRFAEVQVRIVRQSVNVVGDRAAGGALVKQAQGHIAVLQRAGQNIQPGLATNALAGLAQRVLVNVDQVFVGDNF